jgi:hypothetical protein
MSGLGIGCSHGEEVLVDGEIVGEFGMKSGGEQIVFLNQRRLAGMARENGNAGTDAFDNGATDENHFEGILFQSARAEENIAGKLAAVAVAEDGHVEKAERGLRRIVDVAGEEDCACTSAEDGVTGAGEFPDGVVQAFFAEELELRGGLATGKDQAVAGFEIVDGADLDSFGAEGLQSGGVGGEVTLNSENADFQWRRTSIRGKKEKRNSMKPTAPASDGGRYKTWKSSGLIRLPSA